MAQVAQNFGRVEYISTRTILNPPVDAPINRRNLLTGDSTKRSIRYMQMTPVKRIPVKLTILTATRKFVLTSVCCIVYKLLLLLLLCLRSYQ